LEIAELRTILTSAVASPSFESAIAAADGVNAEARFSVFTFSSNPIVTPAMAPPEGEFFNRDES
jgi:hypothetical protein